MLTTFGNASDFRHHVRRRSLLIRDKRDQKLNHGSAGTTHSLGAPLREQRRSLLLFPSPRDSKMASPTNGMRTRSSTATSRSLIDRIAASTRDPTPMEGDTEAPSFESDPTRETYVLQSAPGVWYQSLGSIFGNSNTIVLNDDFHCSIRARAGDEFQSYGHVQPTLAPRPEDRAPGRFHLDLLNRIESPRFDRTREDVEFVPGQLVWKVSYNVHPHGTTTTRDPGGPFVIITRDSTHYALLQPDGQMYDHLVPGHRIVPCTTTWHAVRIPGSLVRTEAVRSVMESSIRE